ncbi:MAG: FtsQ-type POTRA domain-containing protein [Clostridia bacterium]|nr:FtsQ-type POTRA domain-containing protein [Clostridia bacterium]
MAEKRDTAIRKTVKKRNKRRKRRLAWFFAAFMVIAFVVLIVLSATVLFPVKNVIVEGECGYSKEEIVIASGITDDNIIMLSGDKVASRISKALPHCGEITVKKKFPDTVKIIVKAAVPKYYFVLDDVFYIADQNYKVLEKAVEAPEKCILLKYASATAVSPGEHIEFSGEEIGDINNLFSLCESRELNITAVDVSEKMELKIIIDNRLLVLLGSELDLDKKLNHLAATLPKMEANAQGTIDLRSWTSTNLKATFRDEKINILGFESQKTQKIVENS